MSLTKLHRAVLLPLALTLGACATIVGNPTQTIPISSAPSDATISIVDEAGAEVFKGMTPTSVTLNKSTGRYWGGKSYTVTIAKDGYKIQVIPVQSSPNGWYIAGNFIFGGLIGWFIVDPFSGAMYTLSPDAIKTDLPADVAAHNNTRADGSIAILLIQDVPPQLHDKLVPLR